MITVKLINKQGIQNISAGTVKKFLERRGYALNFDLSSAKLGKFASGLDSLPKDKHHVLIACCTNNGHRWLCRPGKSIPADTQYILDCAPRENLVNLLKP